MSTTRKKKNPNSKYTAPYKSTNYLESGYNPPQLWAGASINQEGTYTNLEQPINQNEPAYKGIISYEEANAATPKYGNTPGLGKFNQSGLYGTIGNLSSGYFASQAATSENNADKYYNTGMAIASKAGPVGAIVGGVTAIGDSIGDPIRKRVATTDEQGNIKDTRGFEVGNVVGSYLNPFKSVSETFGKNSSATKGEKALSILGMSGDPLSLGIGTLLSSKRRRREAEEAAKVQIAEKERLEAERLTNEKAVQEAKEKEKKRLMGIQRVSNMEIDPRYLNTSNQAFAQGGDITEYNGNRHEEGGIQLGGNEVEDGETRGIQGTSTENYIFSDRLKTLDNKTTFAMRSKNISKKYSLRPWDHISKNAETRELDLLSKENDIVRKAGELEEAVKAYGGNLDKLRPKVVESMNQGNFTSLENPLAYGGTLRTTDTNDSQYAKGGWIQKATASIKRRGTEGKCTPITKPGCVGKARALALTFKKMARNRKHEEGGNMYPGGGDLPLATVKNVPIRYVQPVDSSRVYIPSQTGSGIAVSTTKRTDSIIGDLMSEINERYNTTENPKTKQHYGNLRKYLASYPTTRLRGSEEFDYYKEADPRLKELLEQPTTMGKLRKRGFNFARGGDFISGVGDYISDNPELINAGIQGVVQSLRSKKINQLQPNTLDYVPISYLDESTYATPISRMAYRPIRNTEQIRGINTAYKGAEKAAANYSDSGDYLNRMTAIGAAKAGQLGRTWEDYYNQEAGRRMQVDQFNKGIQSQNLGRLSDIAMRNRAIEEANVRNKMLTQEYSNAERDALTSLKLQNYGDWNSYLTGATNDLARKRAYEDMMSIERSKYHNYEFYRDKNGRLKSRLRVKATK